MVYNALFNSMERYRTLDTALSRRRQGFESPTGRQHFQRIDIARYFLCRPANVAHNCAHAGSQNGVLFIRRKAAESVLFPRTAAR